MTQPSEINASLAGRIQGLPQLLSLTISDVHGLRDIVRFRSTTIRIPT
jgi:hypothetical protein